MQNGELYPYKILFVEDEDLLRKNYTSYLKLLFKDVYSAKDGQEALLIYKKEKPDIMIVDIHIPKINGLELIKTIRQNDLNVKVIILTAHLNTEFLMEAASLKLVKYLKKPVNRKELKEALTLAINEISNYDIIPRKNFNLSNGYVWDKETKELKHFNEIVDLTNKERLFLELLFSHKNKVFSYDEIFYYVWNDFNENVSLSSLKNLISRLRKKIEIDLIVNVFNEGYKLKI